MKIFTKDVSVNREELIKTWKTYSFGPGSRNSADFLNHTVVEISRRILQH